MYTILQRKIRMFDAMYPGPWVMDTTGVGNPIYDALTKSEIIGGVDYPALYIRSYKFTNQSLTIIIIRILINLYYFLLLFAFLNQ